MTDLNRRVEQSILEYQSRLAHLDEMLARAETGLAGAPLQAEENSSLVELQGERDQLATHLDKLKTKSSEEWLEEEISMSGPMAIWDVVAQKLEKLLERIHK